MLIHIDKFIDILDYIFIIIFNNNTCQSFKPKPLIEKTVLLDKEWKHAIIDFITYCKQEDFKYQNFPKIIIIHNFKEKCNKKF